MWAPDICGASRRSSETGRAEGEGAPRSHRPDLGPVTYRRARAGHRGAGPRVHGPRRRSTCARRLGLLMMGHCTAGEAARRRRPTIAVRRETLTDLSMQLPRLRRHGQHRVRHTADRSTALLPRRCADRQGRGRTTAACQDPYDKPSKRREDPLSSPHAGDAGRSSSPKAHCTEVAHIRRARPEPGLQPKAPARESLSPMAPPQLDIPYKGPCARRGPWRPIELACASS